MFFENGKKELNAASQQTNKTFVRVCFSFHKCKLFLLLLLLQFSSMFSYCVFTYAGVPSPSLPPSLPFSHLLPSFCRTEAQGLFLETFNRLNPIKQEGEQRLPSLPPSLPPLTAPTPTRSPSPQTDS